MAKYHINPETGKTGLCSAREGNCPLAGGSEHYPTEDAARAAYEDKMAGSSMPSVAKKSPIKAEPEAVYVMFEKPVAGKDLKKGDEIDVRGLLLPIRDLKRGYKYATVTVPDLKKGERQINIPLQEEVLAAVRVETEESRNMRRKYQLEKTLELAVQKYKPKREVAVAAIQERIDKGFMLDGFQIGNLVEAEAKDTVMAMYKHEIDRAKEEDGVNNPYTRAQANLQEQFKNEVIQGSARGNSVSSSEASNLYDREMLSAKAEFLRRGPYYDW